MSANGKKMAQKCINKEGCCIKLFEVWGGDVFLMSGEGQKIITKQIKSMEQKSLKVQVIYGNKQLMDCMKLVIKTHKMH